MPYDRGEVVAHLHDAGRVVTTDYEETGTRLHARVYPSDVAALAPFVQPAVARR